MDKPTQKIETHCFAQRSDDKFDFNAPLSKLMEEYAHFNWVVKQISTTSFMWKGEPHIAYTLLLER